ncbi:thioesterase II family protein [Lyngbya sp. CCAP 1446/10]|uniref:thioesterase II family protein n=1 Tax=Lyngbya sp. CCAP 1446/10 TaxID=439293 RepID=UPI00223878E6|nr:thioesterase II family protein [Lyngbya sp. CCAP 1446/10]MCW6050908.1 thioesterase II family protein [Lyngbya sp. CCAP 1446/10]
MNATRTANSWITYPKPNPEAKLRLFCFHYAGGGALSFRAFPGNLPPDVEVCPIELPGRGFRLLETPFTEIEPVIEALCLKILSSLTKPFAFFGHSMGALVSFELARLLRQEYNQSPLHLFVSAHRAPQVPDRDPPIHALPEAEFLRQLCRYNGTPKAVLENAELMELLLPTLRADFAVVENYAYSQEPPLDCPIAAFGGLQDWKVGAEELEAWRKQTNSAFSLEMFPGDHFFLHSDQTLLLQRLSQLLNQIVGQLSPD